VRDNKALKRAYIAGFKCAGTGDRRIVDRESNIPYNLTRLDNWQIWRRIKDNFDEEYVE